MEWDLKMPPWDLAELERGTEPSIGSVVGSSSGPGQQPSRLDCSIDLKLGGLGDFGSSNKWTDQPRVSTMMVSTSGPSKRPRAPSNGSQNAACSVDGCKADLSKCREYHRRHKVCEVHSKTPVVMVGGQEQRFCQQCSRFHLLVEFDEVKRSCRKRLDGHNRRRRKPQPDPANSATLFTNYQGTRFSYPPSFPTATPEPNWTGIIKTEESSLYAHRPPLHLIDRQHHFSDSHSYNKERRQFPFLQDSETTLSSRTALETASVCQPLLKAIPPSESSSSKMFPDGLTQVLDSDCALSLLSSPSQNSSINLCPIVPSADRIPMGQPLVPSLQYGLARYTHSQASNSVSPTGFTCSGVEDEHVGTVLVPGANDAELHCQSIFHVGGEGSSDGASQTLPFSWQ
uniref:Squamosa promoter-binding-like protein 16 n=1 Tax=Elaeis guineensis var. tenera TaxID=51953 RepID=A0A6I9RQQ5_ELAGV|nr:squamosa promoter-binding-like protein 16 [Elaeis guineensis]